MLNLITHISPPRTAMKVFKMLPEGTQCELINRAIYMAPAPLISHQKHVGNLPGQFYNLSKNYLLQKVSLHKLCSSMYSHYKI